MSAHRARVLAAFRERFASSPEVVVRAPGRVNLLGAHVDYNDGLVLPAAIERALWAAAAPWPAPEWHVHTLDLGGEGTVALDRLPPPVPRRAAPTSDWLDYPRGVAWALREGGEAPVGMRVIIGGDLPIGAGVSSSAAFEVALLLAAAALAGRPIERRVMARLGQRVENAYLGVRSGVMDQYACLHGRAGHALLLDCRTLEGTPVPVPEGARALVFDSRVRRRLTQSGFNDRRAECESALERLGAAGWPLRALRDLGPEELERALPLLPPPERLRVRHVVEEIERVRCGAAQLLAGNLGALGELMNASHRSSRDLFSVSIPELDLLQAEAQAAGGYGARLVGGGFGGCVLALVDAAAAGTIAERVGQRFAAAFGGPPGVFATGFAEGAEVVPVPAAGFPLASRPENG